MAGDRLTWWDPASDPGLSEIIAESLALAKVDRPDVLVNGRSWPPGMRRIHELTKARLWNLHLSAVQDAAPDVELVLAHRSLITHRLDEHGHDRFGAEARAAARSSRLRNEAIEAWQRVATAEAVLGARLEACAAYGIDAIAELDRAIRVHHRFAEHLSYMLPSEIQIPEVCREVGLRRIEMALAAVTERESTPNQEAS